MSESKTSERVSLETNASMDTMTESTLASSSASSTTEETSTKSERSKKKKKRSKRGGRYTTTIVDSWLSWTGTLRKKKRSRSLERSQTTTCDAEGLMSHSFLETPIMSRRLSEEIRAPVLASVISQVSQMSLEENEEERRLKHRRKAESKLNELIATERNYVEKNLDELVNGYLSYIDMAKSEKKDESNKKCPVKVPDDLRGGKERIVFANIRDLFDLHQRVILPELESCEHDMSRLVSVFNARRDLLKSKYGRFCLNKPKSEYIIQENHTFFALVQLRLNLRQSISTQMMNPVQRITRYPLLLSEMEKHLRLADDSHHSDVHAALGVAEEIAEYANDMMIAGRITGFQGDVTQQGLLLRRGRVSCVRRRSSVRGRVTKSVRGSTTDFFQIFVFQETILICLEMDTHIQSPFPANLQHFASFRMNKVAVREVGSSSLPFAFELERRENCSHLKSSSSSLSVEQGPKCVCIQCSSEEERDGWLKLIIDQIRELKDVANKLINPMALDL